MTYPTRTVRLKKRPQLLKPLIGVSVLSGVLVAIDLTIGGGNLELAGIDLINLYYVFVALCVVLYLFQTGFYSESKTVQNLSVSVFALCFTLGAMIVLLEKACGYLLSKRQASAPPYRLENRTYPELDGELGIRSHGSQNGFSTLSLGKDTVFNIRLHTDGHGFRITPPAGGKPGKHALFLGCSFTWGSAVDSARTYAALFEKARPDYRGYNFGQGGWGPHTTAALMEFRPVEKWVRERKGFGIYTIIDDQIPRIDNELWHYAQIAGGNQPYYDVEQGRPVFRGLFKDAFPVRDWIFEHLLTKSNFLRYFKIGFPFSVTDADYAKAAVLLNYVKDRYQAKFENSPFWVLVYPGADSKGKLIAALKEKGIEVLDYRNLFPAESEPYKTPFDGHPTPLANEAIVARLLKDIP